MTPATTRQTPRRIRLALASAALIVCACRVQAPGAEGDCASLRRQVVQHLAALTELTSQAAAEGIDVARERVTITTAKLCFIYSSQREIFSISSR